MGFNDNESIVRIRRWQRVHAQLLELRDNMTIRIPAIDENLINLCKSKIVFRKEKTDNSILTSTNWSKCLLPGKIMVQTKNKCQSTTNARDTDTVMASGARSNVSSHAGNNSSLSYSNE
jgi:hypothetical protein